MNTLKTIQQKFQIGQRVITKQIGLPSTGIIVGITHPELWFYQYSGKHSYWKSLYPDYEDKFIYTIMHNKQIPTCTKTEYEQARHNIECTELMYQASVPYSMFIGYPEDDLEEVEV